MEISRRRFFFGAATSLIAAPAIIRTAGLLMPIKLIRPVNLDWGSWVEQMLLAPNDLFNNMPVVPVVPGLPPTTWRLVHAQ